MERRQRASSTIVRSSWSVFVSPRGGSAPGEYVPITLYLRSAGEVTTEPQVFIQLLDENREAIGNVTTHPGWGRNPTSLWQPGAIYEDRYLVRIDRPVSEASPLLATVYVGFTEEPESGEPLPATDAGGQPVEGMVGHVEVQPGRPLDRESLGLAPVAASFDQGIRLIGERHPAALPRATARAIRDPVI